MATEQEDRSAGALERISLGAVAVTALALGDVGLELTLPQWRVLVVCGERPEGATVSEVKERLRSSISPASRLVSRLERRGYVETSKDPIDRRVTRVRPTAAGAEIREKVLQRRREYLAAVLAEAAPIPATAPPILERLGAAFERYT